MGKNKKSKKTSSNDIDNEKTKKVKTVKGKKNKKNRKHPKLMLFIKIMVIVMVLLIIVAAGVVAGIVFGAFGNELEISKENLMIKTSNSVLYDKDGNVITALNGEENREIISMEEMSPYIPKAFVSIEDERFYEHQGVDIKRTASATLNYLIKKGDTSYGGSTITQQLIKNATKDNEKDATRKVKEIVRAFKIEKVMTKNEILETYLNTIPLGGGGKNVYGVQVAARFYFNKSAKDLSLAESAFIAGITHSPNVYNPFKQNPNIERITKRTKTVLGKMKELGDKITEEEYNQAMQDVENGLNFQEGVVVTTTNLSWFAEAALNQIVNQMVEETGLSKEAARSKLYGGGYSINLTQDTAIQKRVEDELKKDKYATKSRKKDGATMQGAMIVVDQYTGHVLGIAGGTGEKSAFGLNRAITPSRNQPGSAIKPLATIAPGLQEGIITAASVFDDTPYSYGGGKSIRNSYGGYKGLSNIRYMICISQNITQVKLIQKITPQKSVEFMTKMGLKSLENETPGDSIVLGGTTNGIPPIEMATAYSVIANGGEYIEPTFYTTVREADGTIIYEPHQERNRVMSEQNAYIEQSILKEPVYSAGGTATDCKISNQEVRGKTGTSNDTYDKWFCGFTGHYTCVTWFGYDSAEKVTYTSAPKNAWTAVMKDIHSNLPKKDFKQPSDIVTATVCKDSGLLATDACRWDPRGSRAYTEIFAKGTVPTKTCETHVRAWVCKETGKLANSFCTNTEERSFITRPDKDKNTAWHSAADAQYMVPTEQCNHTKEADKTAPVISLNGAETISIKLNGKYEEKATAKDETDGDLTSKMTIEITLGGKKVDKIDTSKVGTYIITYSVTDSSGNKATKKRTVKIIKNDDNNTNNTNTNSTNTSGNTTNNTTTNNTTNTTNTNKKQ